MKDLYLSCVHIGSPLFRSEDKIIELLNGEYRNIYLLGDIFDVWEMGWGSILTKYQNIIKVLEEVSERKPVFYIIGNHDPPKFKLQNVFPKIKISYSLKEDINNLPITIIHGDSLDNFLIRVKFISKILYYSFAYPFSFLGFNMRDFLKVKMHQLKLNWNNMHYNSIVLKIEEKAVNDFNHVIMGHTHIPKIIHTDKILYINPGDWVYHRTYIEYSIDINNFCLRNG